MKPPALGDPMPNVRLKVNAGGIGTFQVGGIELPVSEVTIDATAGRGTYVRFQMLANVECEIDPLGVKLVVREVKP